MTVFYGCGISIRPPYAGRDVVIMPITQGVSMFQFALPVRGETGLLCYNMAVLYVSIRPPVRRETYSCLHRGHFSLVSIRPPHAGRDHLVKNMNHIYIRFNSPSPCGERRSYLTTIKEINEVSILPPRAGRDIIPGWSRLIGTVSIRPPRVGRDPLPQQQQSNSAVSIRPPRAGRDNTGFLLVLRITRFNSPSPCGERPVRPPFRTGS